MNGNLPGYINQNKFKTRKVMTLSRLGIKGLGAELWDRLGQSTSAPTSGLKSKSRDAGLPDPSPCHLDMAAVAFSIGLPGGCFLEFKVLGRHLPHGEYR